MTETPYQPVFFRSDFSDGQLPLDTYLSGNASVGVANGELKLLDGFDHQSTGTFASNSQFLTDTGLEVNFTYTARGDIDQANRRYGGGFSFFLVDADGWDAANPSMGAGASDGLGYRGMPGGFLGIGFDSFGNFAANDGGPGNVPQNVTVRGPTVGGNQYIDHKEVTPYGGVDGPQDSPLAAPGEVVVTRDVKLTLSEEFVLNVEVTFRGIGGAPDKTVQVVDDYDLGAALPPALRPESVKFGFSGTVAGRRNNFAIQEIDVLAGANVRKRMAGAGLNLRSNPNLSPRDQLALPRFDATLKGLTLAEVDVYTEDSVKNAFRRLDFADEQLKAARIVLGGVLRVYEEAGRNLTARVLAMGEAEGELMNADIAKTLTSTINLQALHDAGVATFGETNRFRSLVSSWLRKTLEQGAVAPSAGEPPSAES